MTQDDDIHYAVVISEDGRHALWPAFRPTPWGWRLEGFTGSKAACMAHVDKVWTGLRPSPACVE